MVMNPAIPRARVHEGAWGRIRSYLQVGPKSVAEGPLRWVVGHAMASSLAHLVGLLVISLCWVAELDANPIEQLFLAVMVMVGSLLLTGIHWVIVLAASAIVSQLGWLLAQLPRRFAQGLGAVSIGTAFWIVESFGRLLPTWPAFFGLLAFVVGALWGAWLPVAFAPRVAGPCQVACDRVAACDPPSA